ncbi:AraC family transcriptional regulator [Variovorax paradoxus]|uniref:Transcriptional regulator, AraC family n=1 Tax=Variovorax paradoxus (strain EPS) TaxID=595537 RepID=E6VAP7_VARPE|nr:AraC family transcriptional regulator [Variovorax paradoxus]ADU35157.1 transcriptional regulator, AraC family [Variovorax paradoxus EPS]
MHEWHADFQLTERPRGRQEAFVGRFPRAAAAVPGKPALPSDQGSLETLVQSLRFEPFLHFRVRLDRSFCVHIDSHRRAPIYVIDGHDCWLQLGSEPAIALAHGDVVFLPRGGAHRVFSDPAAAPSSFEDLLACQPAQRGPTHEPQAAGSDSVWSGSFYWSAHLASHPLVASLPPVLHLRAADAASWLPFLTDLLRWMADGHTGGKGVGMSETVGTLMQHLVLDWLRRMNASPRVSERLAADMQDPRLLLALAAIHARPAHPWTAESLAGLCHMSRTTFSTRFQTQMHQSPMRYLACWRIHLATGLLREQRLSLDQVAERVGYSTGAILARAYKRVLGISPRGGERKEIDACAIRPGDEGASSTGWPENPQRSGGLSDRSA